MPSDNKRDKYTCPCCGYKVFSEEPGSYEICPVCFWEDDNTQLRYPMEKGANKVSLAEAQVNYENCGASDMDMKIFVRPPNEADEKDVEWRALDITKDKIEIKIDDGENTTVYPIDMTKLYYWEDGFWLKEDCQDSTDNSRKTDDDL